MLFFVKQNENSVCSVIGSFNVMLNQYSWGSTGFQAPWLLAHLSMVAQMSLHLSHVQHQMHSVLDFLVLPENPQLLRCKLQVQSCGVLLIWPVFPPQSWISFDSRQAFLALHHCERQLKSNRNGCFMNTHQNYFRACSVEMAQPLSTLAALPEDLSSIPSNHLVAHSQL